MGFQFWIPFCARSHFQLPNNMSIFKRRCFFWLNLRSLHSQFSHFSKHRWTITLWTIICMRILQPQTESELLSFRYVFLPLFFPCFFHFFPVELYLSQRSTRRFGPVFITSRSLRHRVGSKVGFVYFLTLLGMVVDLLRDFLNAAGMDFNLAFGKVETHVVFGVLLKLAAKEWWTGWCFGTWILFSIYWE